MTFRRIALAAAAVVALAATQAGAALAPQPQITDPVGDAQFGQSAHDIKAVTYEITAKKAFQVTLEVAGTAAVGPGLSYQMTADTACGFMYIYAYFSALDGGPSSSVQFGECGTDGVDGTGLLLDHQMTTAGSKITWTLPFSSLPKNLQTGLFENANAYTALTEPVVGYTTADFVPETAIDLATAAKAFKLK